MPTLNSKGEVCDFLDVSQFIPGRSAYECVAYSAALIKYCGLPGHGPTGTTLQASNLAQFWYGKEEGSNDASNTNGMSLDAEYNMLVGMGLKYSALGTSLGLIIHTLSESSTPTPIMLCAHENSLYDLDLGDRVPYAWTPTGNHCIVLSGIASDGNLLVHDCANIAPSGVRPGPRRYDASKIQIVSATAVHPFEEEEIMIDISMPEVAHFFEQTDAQHWKRKDNGKVIQYAILDFYKRFGNSVACGLTWLGLPVSNEIALTGSKHGAVKQHYENGVVFYDPAHEFDIRPGLPSTETVYLAHIYSGQGQDPALAQLEQQLAQAQKPPVQGIDPATVANRLSAIGLQLNQAEKILATTQTLVTEKL